MKSVLTNRNLSILLLTTATVEISFGGIIMRNIYISDPLQIAFYRGLAFLFSITLVIFYKFRLGIVTKIINVGFPSIAGGFSQMISIYYLLKQLQIPQ
tara:strand:+ start:249 stop:542 length:294 start_codon:yes stop_codon:yes gene_type:complete